MVQIRKTFLGFAYGHNFVSISKNHLLTPKSALSMEVFHSRFTSLKKIDYSRPETKPVYMVNVIDDLKKMYRDVSGNFIEWFGEGHEEMPGRQYHLGYGESKFPFTYGEAHSLFVNSFGTKPSLMQILLSAQRNKILADPKKPLIAFPEDRYRSRVCVVVIHSESITIDFMIDDTKIVPNVGFIFGSSSKDFLDEKKYVPPNKRFTLKVN